jgi:hypothetical protein
MHMTFIVPIGLFTLQIIECHEKIPLDTLFFTGFTVAPALVKFVSATGTAAADMNR